MRAMTPSATSLMSPVFHDLTIENESGGVIARNVRLVAGSARAEGRRQIKSCRLNSSGSIFVRQS